MAMKHVGLFGEKKCVVLFREVPNEPENCLIVQTEQLEDRMHDDLMNAVQSAEAQQSNQLAEVLKRKQFTSGEEMLSALHYNKRIQKVPANTVDLTPVPGQRVSLADVNAAIREREGGYVPPKTDGAHLDTEGKVRNPVPPAMEVKEGEEAQVAANLQDQARMLREDAERMVKEAEAKEAQAKSLAAKAAPAPAAAPAGVRGSSTITK